MLLLLCLLPRRHLRLLCMLWQLLLRLLWLRRRDDWVPCHGGRLGGQTL